MTEKNIKAPTFMAVAVDADEVISINGGPWMQGPATIPLQPDDRFKLRRASEAQPERLVSAFNYDDADTPSAAWGILALGVIFGIAGALAARSGELDALLSLGQ